MHGLQVHRLRLACKGSLTMTVFSKAVATSFCVRKTIEGAFWDAEAWDPGWEDQAFADGEATEVGSGIPAA